MKGVLISAKPKAAVRSRKAGSRKAGKPARRPRIDSFARTLPTPQHPPVVGETHSWLQTKLEVGEPDDQLEQEADRVADQVMRMPDSAVAPPTAATSSASSTLQRMCTECEEEEQIQRKCAKCEEEETVQRQEMDEEEELIQSKRDGGGRTPAVTPAVASDLARLRRGGGRPLGPSTRAFFEPRFGQDFSGVRVHTGDDAGALSQRLNARAFAVGNDVFFANGKYQPRRPSGLRLLAHELTHTVQQSGGRSLSESASPDPVAADPMTAGAPRAVRDRPLPGGSAATRGAGDATIRRMPAEPEPDGESPEPAEEIEAPTIEEWEGDPWLQKVRTDEVGANNFLVAKGARGVSAELVQKAVRAWGITQAENPRDLLPLFGADGKFESETKSAVQKFQRAHGLDDDGIVGPLTMAELDAFVRGAADKPATIACPPGLFEVKSFKPEKGAARKVLHPAPVLEGQSGANVAIIPSGDVTVTAKFEVHAPTAAAKAALPDWKLGLTQTMYDEMSLTLWERS
ncbi:MAG: DUF4157 domain-containing protein, partial [Thermoanaerobaculia bacterium]